MTELLWRVGRHGATHADANGTASTPIPGLATVRATGPSGLVYAVSRPIACLVVQGRKRVATGTSEYGFGAGDTLLVTADVPTVSQITSASPAAPYLSLVVELDAGLIAELALALGPVPDSQSTAVQVDPTAVEVADAALRLMRLLDRPAAQPVLTASTLRELHYWLLTGRHGPAVRRLGFPDGHVGRVARAVAMLRSDFARPIRVERLAALAGMSLSSFHHHFRAVTSLSPVQFQKQLRLIEARRLMTGEGMTASSAAYAVGYESVPQFTREYGRAFGVSPAADANQARVRPRAA